MAEKQAEMVRKRVIEWVKEKEYRASAQIALMPHIKWAHDPSN
jgi:hypothetical protein